MKTFLQDVRETNEAKFSHKLLAVAWIFAFWFVFASVGTLAFAGWTHAMGSSFDQRFATEAKLYEEAAKEDSSKAPEYQSEAKARRALDGVFTETSNQADGYIPRWWQSGLLVASLWAMLALFIVLAVAVIDRTALPIIQFINVRTTRWLE